VGETLKYWRLFPAPKDFGTIPAWGFGDVIASKHPGISEGERLFGYFPMATHLVIEPLMRTSAAYVTAPRIGKACRRSTMPICGWARIQPSRAARRLPGAVAALVHAGIPAR